MDFKILNSSITDSNIKQQISNKVKFEELDRNLEYDLYVDFYNKDLIEESLNNDVSYEIKKKHFKFIKIVRGLFEENNIKINKFYLMGSIIEPAENEIEFSILKSNFNDKSNIIWPCKEIFIYEDSKNKLDDLLFKNQISVEEYESNLEDLKFELSIYENEEDHEYLN